MPKIALAMIVKGDEGDKLKRCLDSVKNYVDGIFVTITTKDENVSRVVKKVGTSIKAPYKFHTTITKEQVDFIKDFGLNPYIKEGDKIFEFDKARNFSFEQVPEDFEYILWLDADDIMLNAHNLPKVLEIMEQNKLDASYFNYLYQVEADDKGKIKNILIQHLRERVVRRDVFKWVAPIHETLIPQKEHRSKDLKLCEVAHLSDDSRMQENFKRNVKTLELSIYQTQGKDPRPIYYLGKAHYDEGHLFGKHEHFEPARLLFNKYLYGENPSGWAEERAQCWDFLAEIERDLGNVDKSIECSLNSFAEYGQNPATYISLALSYIDKKDYKRAEHWIKLATAFKQPETTLVTNPKELQGRSLEVAYHLGLNKPDLNMAADAAKAMYELDPNQKIFKDRLNFVMGLLEQRELTRAAATIAKHLSIGQASKLKPFLASLPQEIADNPFMIDLHKKVFPPRKHNENEITIYCGPGFTNWSPSLMENPNGSFMGGSEEAVVYVTRELAKLGWDVTVYGDPAETEVDEGATYEPYYKFNPDDTFNIVISWRQPHLADLNLNCKGLYIWNHDVINQMDYTKERLDNITKLLVLSPAHRKNIPNIPDDKIVISANGVTYEK